MTNLRKSAGEVTGEVANLKPRTASVGSIPTTSAILEEAFAAWQIAKHKSFSGIYFWATKYVDKIFAELSNGRILGSESRSAGSNPASASNAAGQ